MKKKITLTLALLITLFASWYWLSPQWTLSRMRDAAEANDPERLASYVDFPALRESVKQELKGQMAVKLMNETDGMKGFGGLIAMGMIDGMVDAMVTPQLMRNAFAKDKTSEMGAQARLDLDAENTTFVRDSFDQFRLRHDGRADLVFGRSGLSWKLVGIRAPADVTATSLGSNDLPPATSEPIIGLGGKVPGVEVNDDDRITQDAIAEADADSEVVNGTSMPAVFVGKWGTDKANCSGDDDYGPISVRRNGFGHYETSADLIGVTERTNDTFDLRLRATDVGSDESYAFKEIWRHDSSGNLVATTFEGGMKSTTTYQRC